MGLSKLGKYISIPQAIFLIICFFLPWLELSCDPGAASDGAESGGMSMKMTVGTASGWQLASGDMTADPMPMGPGMQPPGQPGQPGQPAQPEVKQKNPSESVEARPLFFIGLLLPVLLLGLGVLSVVKGGDTNAKAMILIGILGLVICFMAMGVDYSDDMAEDPKPAEGEAGDMGKAMADQMSQQMSKALVTESMYGLTLTIVLYISVLVAGFVSMPKTSRVPQKTYVFSTEAEQQQPSSDNVPSAAPTTAPEASKESGGEA